MKRLLLLAVAAALLATPAFGRFIRPDLERIPVERLVSNLEDLAKKEPKDAKIRFNLARVHAMAYALKTDSAEVWKGRAGQGAWFGYTPAFVPFKPIPTKDEDKAKAAQEHLKKAIADYQAALQLDPKLLAAELGLAWLLEQSGEKEKAIKAYRAVIEKGWREEKDQKGGPLGGNFITKEAAGYLIPLLKKEKDDHEIDTLKERVAKLDKLPRPVTPIVIPLRDGLTAQDIEDRAARVAFDADGTGRTSQRWTWISKDAGWLVYDPQAKGKVTSALQMFGSVTFWTFWDNGYQALRTLDDDGDGILSGKELDGLAIWHDANGNGVCDPGEVRPLSDYGIVAIDCRSQRDPNHPDRIYFAPRGVILRDGTSRPTFDIILAPRK
jgi:tetratricopeptide (TPR) repeat protein